MKQIHMDDYLLAGYILLATSAITLLLAALTDHGDLTSGSLVLGGLACFAGGIFVLTFSKEEPIDPAITNLMVVPGTLAVCRLCADMGVHGKARFIPTEKGIVQFIPAGEDFEGLPPDTLGDSSFVAGDKACGVVIPPAGLPLLDYLKKEHNLTFFPGGDLRNLLAVKTVFEDVLELADTVETRREDDHIVVAIHGFRLFDCCAAVHATSPKCCTMNPCPTCSLVACILVEGSGRMADFDRIKIEPRNQTIYLTLSII